MTKMKTRWVVLQHVEWEGSGIIAREAEKRGCEVDIRRLDREDEIPTVDHMGGLVVMGGPLGAYEEDRYPFLRKECELLRAVTGRGVPVFGVCLGAQLLAKALGAKVFPGRGAEIGFGSIELAEAGRQDESLRWVGRASARLPLARRYIHIAGRRCAAGIEPNVCASGIPVWEPGLRASVSS